MKQLIEFPLKDGGSITVEVDEPQAAGTMRKAARLGEIAAQAGQTLEDALDKIKPAAQAIVATLRDLHDAPDEVGVEFSVKLTAAAGAVIASASAEANYKVTLKWTKK